MPEKRLNSSLKSLDVLPEHEVTVARGNALRGPQNSHTCFGSTNMWKKSIDLATTIKLGTRVKRAEDGLQGKIVWANASAVKIEWTDGEKSTWKRSELGAKGLVVIDSEVATEPQAPEASTPPVDEPARSEVPEFQQPAHERPKSRPRRPQ
jgi:hypothetical protein